MFTRKRPGRAGQRNAYSDPHEDVVEQPASMVSTRPEVTAVHQHRATSRSTGRSPFELLFGVNARHVYEDRLLVETLEREIIESFEDGRNEMRSAAKECIAKVQEENRRVYNRSRKKAHLYHDSRERLGGDQENPVLHRRKSATEIFGSL